MKTLFVQRKLLNAKELREWALEEGFKTTVPLEEFHCTCAFSSKKVDWNKLRLSTVKEVSVTDKTGKRTVQALGDKGAVVLKFSSQVLHDQWQKLIDQGCSWDYESYQPHITITYNGKKIDCSKIEPFDGDLLFGPQEASELDDNFVNKLKEI